MMEIESASSSVVEGHLKWLYELESYIQKSAKSHNETLKSYCGRLLRVSENGYGSAEEDDDDGNQDQPVGENISWEDKATLLSRKLNNAAMWIVVGDRFKADSLLEQVYSIFNKLVDKQDAQARVIMQCRDSLKWKIREKNDGERLNRMWEELTAGKVEAQATVYFLRGMLGVDLKIDGNKITELYLQAADLDPTCLVWCHHVYRSMRRNRGKGANQGGPFGKERSLVERAYHLCDGQNPMIALDFGLLLKEKLWARKRDDDFWSENFQMYTKCVQALENAEKISKGPWKMKSKLYLAELLYFGSAPEPDRKRGREMLLELKQEFPNSFCVLHKLGNLYRTEEDYKGARECYQRALKRKPTVMPCIMDFLKLLKRQGDRREIIKILDKALSPEYIMSDRDQEILQMERDRMQQPQKKPWLGNLSVADRDTNWRK